MVKRKQNISELPSVNSVKQKYQRTPSFLFSQEACAEDKVHSSMALNNTSEMDSIKMLYKLANQIHNSISVFHDVENRADSIIIISSRDDVPSELYTLICWVLVGPEEELHTEMRSRTVGQSALTIRQNIMYAFKTKRQVQNKPKQITNTFRTQLKRGNPQVLGLALTVHNDTRNKKQIKLLHVQNYCVLHKHS